MARILVSLPDTDFDPFVLEDGNCLSAPWPGDACLLARRLLAKLAAARVLGQSA